MKWNPGQYNRFASERGRPFADLVARIGSENPRRVVDVGCGPGNMTALLPQRWPGAVVEGIDASEEMVAAAAAKAPPEVQFRVETAETWDVPDDADVIISNATLQRVDGHRHLLRRWAADLPPGGWLAVQIPSMFSSPAHTLLRDLARSAPYVDVVGHLVRGGQTVGEPVDYASLLLGCDVEVDVWETTYLHLLQGADPVLEWIRGTRLQPILDALPVDHAVEFERTYAAQLAVAYPTTPRGTILPYRRVFAVAHRPLTP